MSRRDGLREAREAANLTQEEIAERVGVDRTTIGRWERGERTPPPGDMRALLADVLGITLSELHACLSSMPVADDEMPRWLVHYLAREQSAIEVAEHQPYVIAGLAQTQDYAGAIARSVGTTPPSDDYVQRTKDMRALRQERIHSGAMRYTVLMPEFPLILQMGSTAIMADQLDHLAALTRQDNISVQIVPADRGQYEALRIGIYSLLTHPWAPDRPSVHLEGYGGARTIDAPSEVSYFSEAFEHGQRLALSPTASVRLIEQRATEWRQQADDDDR